MSDGNNPVWNSLERAKLVVSIFTPVLLVVISFLVWEVKDEVAQSQAEQSRIRELRINLYSKTGPLLNDIFAYHFYVGKWKELTPHQIISHKRSLDSIMYSNEPFFSKDFFEKYQKFMWATFKTTRGWHKDTALRTLSKCHKRPEEVPVKVWQDNFTDEDNRKNVCIAYTRLLSSLSRELLFVTLEKERFTDSEIIKELSKDEGKTVLKACPPLYNVDTC